MSGGSRASAEAGALFPGVPLLMQSAAEAGTPGKERSVLSVFSFSIPEAYHSAGAKASRGSEKAHMGGLPMCAGIVIRGSVAGRIARRDHSSIQM